MNKNETHRRLWSLIDAAISKIDRVTTEARDLALHKSNAGLIDFAWKNAHAEVFYEPMTTGPHSLFGEIERRIQDMGWTVDSFQPRYPTFTREMDLWDYARRLREIQAAHPQEEAGPSIPVPLAVDTYYLLSLKWIVPQALNWWGPKCSGYTIELEKAGVYSRAEIEKILPHHDPKEVVAIPCAIAERYARRIVHDNHLCEVREFIFGQREPTIEEARMAIDVKAAYGQLLQNQAAKSRTALQERCPHARQEHHRQEYVGRWSDCLGCGKQDV